MLEDVLTIREVADILKINEKTVYKLAAASKIPGMKVGGSWRFDRPTIAAWLKTKVASDTEVADDRESDSAEPVDTAVAVPTPYSPQQGTFFANRITLEGTGEDAFAQSL